MTAMPWPKARTFGSRREANQCSGPVNDKMVSLSAVIIMNSSGL